ncbi:DMT family transporter [Agrobacterium rhizogenes]|uniref:DMT family transporter n=1 Tax=Rhizobium rhizogenes TaxID=359 RepID=UPI00080F928C|nr:DMT family transporter [Rhizobium rhizogenes]OCJ21570.1 multidrug DMT transporter permease [Agrobacterium sp. B131/95]OCJ26982.1 multidrug DMT transporter permease [Agrobacterium sp. B133/95]MDJ1633375.1 DMT family transporter [Rhizobium rhizogenes]NTI40146.1 DMT family transporter [Rhizobium rhizogenes]NTI47195.1 DMT family transporter [Rhizobium rhizogenes]
MNEIRRGTVEMTAAMLISGTIGWFVLMSGQPVTGVVFWRCLIGALTLLVICGAMGLLRPGILSLRTFAIAVGGGVAIVLNWLLLFAAYSHASISIATTVYNTQPFMLLGLGALFLGEKITLTKLFWLGLAFAGMIIIVEGKSAQTGTAGSYLIGILLSLSAAFFYALAAIAAKWLKGTPPHLIALIQVSTGILMLAPFTDFSDLPQGAGGWSILATMGIVHTGLMYVLLYGAIQKLPTHLTGALSFIYPIAAIVVDRFAFGHVLGITQIVGAVIILAAAAGMNLGWTIPLPRPKSGHLPKEAAE